MVINEVANGAREVAHNAQLPLDQTTLKVGKVIARCQLALTFLPNIAQRSLMPGVNKVITRVTLNQEDRTLAGIRQ